MNVRNTGVLGANGILATVLAGAVIPALSAGIASGPAPAGDAKVVAARIIKANFDACRTVSAAQRRSDGTIRAKCEGVDYWVFTMTRDGKPLEIAMNCSAAKKLGVSCD